MGFGYERGLQQIADDVWAWLSPDGGWGLSNAGVVAGQGEALLVDTLYDLRLTRDLLSSVDGVLAGRPITGAVNTHANGDHCFGNELLGADVRIHAAKETLPGMHEAPPQLMATLITADLGPVLTPYIRKCFGAYAFDEITLREPDTLFEGSRTLDVGGREVRLHDLGPAHTDADTVVHVPDAGVLFTGDLLFIEGTPIMWAGPAGNWIAACDRMLAMDAEIVVPGHGPITDHDGIRAVRGYFEYVSDYAKTAHAQGKTYAEAAFDIDLGPYTKLGDAERIVITMHALYRELDPSLPAVDNLTLFGVMATWAAQHPAT